MTENPCIGFIGLGLIGGSLAKSIRRAFPLASLYAFDQNRENTRLALHEGVINRICTEKDPAFGECDYIFLCTPVKNNITYLPFLRDIRKAGCIISDVGSVKGEMHRAVTDAGMENCFIGGHPMAGSEKSGYENATDFLMENAYYLITPAGEVDVMRLAEFMELITAIRAIPMVMTFEEHDYVTAAVSHLPHIVAASLVNAIRNLDTSDQCMKQIAAGGFRDITRIASSSPVMWQQICLSNGPAISRVWTNISNFSFRPAVLWTIRMRRHSIRFSVPPGSIGMLCRNLQKVLFRKYMLFTAIFMMKPAASPPLPLYWP